MSAHGLTNKDDIIEQNLSLAEIKTLTHSNLFTSNERNKGHFVTLLWNANTISIAKLNFLRDVQRALQLEKEMVTQTSSSTTGNKEKINIVDVIAVTEMGKKNSKFNCFNMPGYKLYSILRENRKGGGIGLYIKKEFSVITRKSLIHDDYEMMLIEIIINDSHHKNLMAIYRPPSGDISNFLNAIEPHLLNSPPNLTILGDFNINSRASTENLTLPARRFFSMLDSFGMRILNQAITRFNNITNNHSQIDHVIKRTTESESLVLTSDSSSIQKYSDHNLLFLIEPGSSDLINPIVRKSIKKVNNTKIVTEIKNNLSSVLFEGDTHEKTCQLEQSIMDIIAKNTSVIKIKTRDPATELPPWSDKTYAKLTNSIHNLSDKINRKTRKHEECSQLAVKLNQLISDRDEYGRVRSIAYYNDIATLDPRAGWKIINSLSGRTRTTDTIVLEDEGHRITHPKLVADTLQKHFLSIVGKKENVNSLTIFSPPSPTKFHWSPVSVLQAETLLMQLDAGKATGFDGISPSLWQKISDCAGKFVSDIINSMFAEGVFPDVLKMGLVHAIPKKAPKTDKQNYRPITVPMTLSKVLEQEMHNQYDCYMTENKLYDSNQFGYKKRKGANELMSKVVNIISTALDRKAKVLIISLDCSKAFDTIDHEILCLKLKNNGMDDKELSLIRSFLTNRQQTVIYNNNKSEPGDVIRGVPQGSILGPLLFNIYINDIKDLPLTAQSFKFADDNLLIWTFEKHIKSDTIKLQIRNDLYALNNYYEINKLQLNLNKSKALCLGNFDEIGLDPLLDDFHIQRVESIDYLGVNIDNQLKFNDHTETIYSKLSQVIGAICTLKNSLTTKQLINFYYAHFQSTLCYCSFLILRCPATFIYSLQVLQNRIFKIIFTLPHDFSTEKIFTEKMPRTLPVMGLLIYSVLMQVKKSLVLNDGSLVKFEWLSSSRTGKLSNPTKGKFSENDIGALGVNLFNCLPKDLRLVHSINYFKSNLKRYLLSKNATLSSRRQMSTKTKIL